MEPHGPISAGVNTSASTRPYTAREIITAIENAIDGWGEDVAIQFYLTDRLYEIYGDSTGCMMPVMSFELQPAEGF